MRRIFIETEDPNIVEEITDDVMILVNLLMASSQNRSDHFYRSCHNEADIMYNRITGKIGGKHETIIPS